MTTQHRVSSCSSSVVFSSAETCHQSVVSNSTEPIVAVSSSSVHAERSKKKVSFGIPIKIYEYQKSGNVVMTLRY